MTIPFTPPMECLPVKKLPDGPEWVYELKLDGYRAQAIRETNGTRLLSRNGKDLSKRFSRVVSSLADAIMPNTVATDADGRPSFQALQNAKPRYARHVLRLRHPHGQRAGRSCFAPP